MNKYYIYGIHAVLAALQNDKRIVHMVYTNQRNFDRYRNIISMHKYMIIKDFSHFQLNRHQNFIAHVDRLRYQQVNMLGLNEIETVIVLDNVTDTFNIGSIIRTAVNLNAKYMIVMKRHGVHSENASIVKAAAGMFEKINYIPVVNIVNTIKFLKEKGFWIMGLSSYAHNSIDSVTRIGKRIAIVIGAEDKGIRSLVQKNLDVSIKIPISGESLNASNAAAIALFALRNK
ncbi:MAG: RNA methyltransferase [Pseudomonadota bacterium]